MKSRKETHRDLWKNKQHPWVGRKHTQESKKKMSLSKTGKYLGENNPNYGKTASKEKRKKISIGVNMALENGKMRYWQGKRLSKNHRAKLSEKWKDPNHVKKVLANVQLKPNRPEKKITKILDKFLPGEWKYCGDWTVNFGGKCPDFINVNGQKKLIEMFGDYWHDQSEVEPRKAHFKQFGFDTLVIWEHELKDLQTVEQKLLDFHKKGVKE